MGEEAASQQSSRPQGTQENYVLSAEDWANLAQLEKNQLNQFNYLGSNVPAPFLTNYVPYGRNKPVAPNVAPRQPWPGLFYGSSQINPSWFNRKPY